MYFTLSFWNNSKKKISLNFREKSLFIASCSILRPKHPIFCGKPKYQNKILRYNIVSAPEDRREIDQTTTL